MQCCKTVTLRSRDRRNGTKSLFLDFYPGYRNPETMELIRRRALGIYIYKKPVTFEQKEFNRQMLEKAEAIRCKVYAEIINERYDFFEPDKLKESFLDFFYRLSIKHHAKWEFSYKHFAKFCGGACTFGGSSDISSDTAVMQCIES